MAGSRKNFVYTDDSGATYWLNLDESNTEAVNGNSFGYPASGGPVDALPRNIKPRRVFYVNPARTRTISCIVMTQAAYTTIVSSPGATITDPLNSPNLLLLARAQGERIRIPISADTGQDDGDQP